MLRKNFLSYCFFCLTLIISGLTFAKTINIALVIPMTGNYAGYGNQLLAGASQAVKNINKTGGILGDTLAIIPYDDKCQINLAKTIAKKLAKDQTIHAIIGHVTSATTLAAMPNYTKAKKLMITATATNPAITQKNLPTVFRISGRDDQQSKVIAKFITHELQSQRIAILHDQDLYGKNLADYVLEKLAKLKQRPVLYQGIARGTKNLTKIIEKFKDLEVDAVFYAALYPEVGNLAKAMQQAELQIPLITGDSIALNSFITAAGNRHAATTVIMSFGQEAKTIAQSKTIIEEMRQNHLETNGYAMYAYSAVQAIAAAMQATKSTNGLKLANWLHQNTVDTVLGLKSWDTNGDIIAADYNMHLWHNYGNYSQISATY
jgi:branched-chain amino acid transport system substrate-binding protein